ncbi:hypothetical protein EI696_17300 [Salmonella enterica]|nr:hypothetical protein [Salmonella enterica]ECH8775686.1 hypothetical protein [Salmonella enterica subsp. houtenae]VUD24069.1 type III secretion system effector protein [Salmonella sp. NCTC 7297]EAS4516875.1 hypothetical protein [Salmonella enterica]ECT8363082.1 hypothetical protein [Salmonella enterica]
MPLSFPNVYLNTRGKIETLSLDILDSIRNAAREMPDSTNIKVQLRDALYRVRHQPDDGTFEVAHGVNRGKVIVIFGRTIHKVLVMREDWPCN